MEVRIHRMIRPAAAAIAALLIAFNFAAPVVAAPPTPEAVQFFENKVRPVFAEHCYRCHGPSNEDRKAGLRVDHISFLLKGGDTGNPAVVPGKPDESYLFEAISHSNNKLLMPKGGDPLPEATVAAIRQWIAEGAAWPDEPIAKATGTVEQFDLEHRKREHWAWQPLNPGALPKVKQGDWPRDDLDIYLLARLEAAKLAPAPEADRRTLIRRVYFDLIGLPPTPKAINDFVSDTSPDAFEKVVDGLLASPRFGERWGRHWLDLMRYAETYGHEFDYVIPQAWPYRDYVIRALNADVPYDQFVKEHVAGDLMPQPRKHETEGFNESIIGTGFWWLSQGTHAPVDVRMDEAERVDNQIDVFSKSFLGVTVACARCHDHKFDAISTQDFYSLAGFIQSSRRQHAFLDPQGKIAAARAQTDRAYTQGEAALADMLGIMSSPTQSPQSIANYLVAARTLAVAQRAPLVDGDLKIEAESLKQLSITGGTTEAQVGLKEWSGGKQLWWRDGKVGDTLSLALDAPAAGRYELIASFTQSYDYAIATLRVNDKPASDAVDLYAAKAVAGYDRKFGIVELNAGQNTLVLEIKGRNESAQPRFMVGLDFIVLRPIPQDGPILFEDFEANAFDGWVATGDAFGERPIAIKELAGNQGQMNVTGNRLLNSYNAAIDGKVIHGDGRTGTLTSRLFKIERDTIQFLISGGAHGDKTCINLLVDGKVVLSQDGKNSNTMTSAAFDVKPWMGQKAQLQIVDQHKSGWGHIGIDEIVFRNTQGSGPPAEHLAVAKQGGLDAEQLGLWSSALRDAILADESHPLHALHALSDDADKGPDAFVAARDRLAKSLHNRDARAASAAEQYVVFEDFESVPLNDWYVSGQAFEDRPVQRGQWDSQGNGRGVFANGMVHSGLRGDNFQGVIRSKTFEITKKFVQYRMAGQGAQIRLIIDGFFLDTANGLLFEGMAFDVKTEGKWVWHNQGINLEKYLGHRAHIEIKDEGGGWVAVDEIRFSDHGPSAAAENKIASRIVSDKAITTYEQLAHAYGDEIARVMDAAADHNATLDAQQAMILDWALEHRLLGVDRSAEAAIEKTAQAARAAAGQAPEPIRVLAMHDGSGEDEFIFIRGNPKTPGKVAPRRMLTAIAGDSQTAPAQGSGRLQLANRMFAPDNPLPSRVMVNRVWHHLMGRGIAATTDDLGVLGLRPTHPQLLDYLAKWYQTEGQWSTKALIRKMVLSQTYRMSSTPDDPVAEEIDPNNDLLHRARIKRLEGEVLRDSMLAVSGRLDTAMYGDPVPIHLTKFMTGRGRPGGSGPLDGNGRRSIYIAMRRNFLSPMMLAFDTPIPHSTVGKRSVSNVPAQALILLNDPFVHQQADIWAKRILESPESPPMRIDAIYEAGLGRLPSNAERARAIAFMREQGSSYNLAGDAWQNNHRIWADFCHVIFNVKDFVFVN